MSGHVGIERMEAATVRLSWPKLPRPSFGRDVRGRIAGAGLAGLVLTGLAVAGRPPVPDLPKALVRFDQATDARTGQPVTRDEWIARAVEVQR